MAARANSAARVYNLLIQAKNQAADQQTAQAWAKVFAMNFKPQPGAYAAIARRLALVSEELEDAYRQMKATDHSKEIYENTFNNARRAIGLEALNAQWKSVKTSLDGDILTILKFCSEVLPDEGSQIPEEQRGRLNELLAQLRQEVEDPEVPDELRVFIISQVEIIQRALADYPIVGDKAFDRAVGEVLVRYAEYADVVERHKNSKQLSLLDRAWNQILTWSTRLSALRNYVSTGQSLFGLLGSGDTSV